MEMEERIALVWTGLQISFNSSKLESDKDELEAIHDMDEQLAETQKDIERDLRKDMDVLNGKIREVFSLHYLFETFQLIQKLLVEEKHNDDLMKTIMKFREKTAALNEQIQDRDDQV